MGEMWERESNGPVSLGQGTVIHDTGKAIRVELAGRPEPLWVPAWAVHPDSEIWKLGQDPGELVVLHRFAEKNGLAEDVEEAPSSPSARTMAKRREHTLADEIRDIKSEVRDLRQEVKALGSDMAALRFIMVKMAEAWDIEVFEGDKQ